MLQSIRDSYRNLRRRWDDYVGDRDLENKIRAELVREGLPRSSSIREARLVAIQRPGWVQVYRFRIEGTLDGEPFQRWGVALDDGRSGTKLELSRTVQEADRIQQGWSEGMIVRGR